MRNESNQIIEYNGIIILVLSIKYIFIPHVTFPTRRADALQKDRSLSNVLQIEECLPNLPARSRIRIARASSRSSAADEERNAQVGCQSGILHSGKAGVRC